NVAKNTDYRRLKVRHRRSNCRTNSTHNSPTGCDLGASAPKSLHILFPLHPISSSVTGVSGLSLLLPLILVGFGTATLSEGKVLLMGGGAVCSQWIVWNPHCFSIRSRIFGGLST